MENRHDTRLDQLAATFDLPDEAHDLAGVICHRAFAQDLHQRHSSMAVLVGTLYAAARHTGAPSILARSPPSLSRSQ